jgi:hypothetical protein
LCDKYYFTFYNFPGFVHLNSRRRDRTGSRSCYLQHKLPLAACRVQVRKKSKKLNKWLSSEAKFTKNVWGKTFMIFTKLGFKNLIFKSNSVLKQKSRMVKASYRKNSTLSIFNFKMHLKVEKSNEFSLRSFVNFVP